MQKILIIDDDLDIRLITAAYLHKENFEVLEAENGFEGLRLARAYQPDLIICDIAMPGMDGYNLLANLHQDPVTASIPFIFLTSYGDRESIRQGMILGADDFLVKPVSGLELIKSVKARFKRQQIITTGYNLMIQQAQNQVDYLRKHDSITGLPNRNYFMTQFEQFLEQSSTTSLIIFQLRIDCHLLRQVLGWEAEELFLSTFIEQLSNYQKQFGGLVSRFDSDRFVLVVPGANNLQSVDHLAQELVQEIIRPFGFNEQKISARINLGISRYPQDGKARDELLHKADYALEQSVRDGNLAYSIYNTESAQPGQDLLALQTALTQALARGELQLYYQPQFETKTRQLIGAEALLRWNNPELGRVAPGKFIPLAEKMGLIEPISRWVLQTACNQNQLWQQTFNQPLKMGVNLSALEFQQSDFSEYIGRVLENSRMAPGTLDLELTESVLMHDIPTSLVIMQNLKQYGMKLSLDDFGTGYSSLSHLKRFPFDTLKIDQAFTRELIYSSRTNAIVASIIDLAHALDLRVIAEGVETSEQLALLKELGCEEVQGFYLGKPLPATEFERNFLSVAPNIQTLKVS